MNDNTLYFPKLLWVILALALGIRLLGASVGELRYDESTHLACANTIDLRTGSFNLVYRSVDHPLLSVYVVRLSSYLFGESNLGLRVIHVLFGTMTVAIVFLLGKKIFSEKAGLWAAALLSVDKFHLTWSNFIVPEVLMLFFVSLVLLQFLRATETKSRNNFILLGILLGLSYLAKETSVLLVPILWLYVVIDRDLRSLIWSSNWYIMHAVALLVISPDIIWNYTHVYEGYFYRDAKMISSNFSLSTRAIILFIGEFWPLLGFGHYGGSHWITLDVCHWFAGLLYLSAALGMVLSWWSRSVRLLLLTFFGVLLFFTIIPTNVGKTTFWWSSISILVSVILAGRVLEWFAGQISLRFVGKPREWLPMFLSIILMCYLCFHAVARARHPGYRSDRHSAIELAEACVQKARLASSSKELRSNEWLLQHTLHIVGPHAEIYAYIARIAYDRKQIKKSKYYVHKCLELDSDNEIGNQLLKLLKRQRQIIL